MKRQEYISWDTYFMGIAQLSSKRSKDPKTQVGACIVSPENKIVGINAKNVSSVVFIYCIIFANVLFNSVVKPNQLRNFNIF